MIESAFLNAVAAYLSTKAHLSPVPATIGVVEPAAAADTPAVVLGLKRSHRLGNGLGERSAIITDGALAWQASIDLANPVLATDPTFTLLSPDRKRLILPNGGLVRRDGSHGPLAASDLTVALNGGALVVVASAPAGNQVTADPDVGTLTFGTPLPATGTVTANFFLGQWEQRTQSISGTLRVAVKGADPNQVQQLSDAVANAFDAQTISGLTKLRLLTLGAVSPPDAAAANLRTREMLFSFLYQLEINQPDSSGGIILRIPINANVG
jgi:hypothetical protein